MKQFRKYLFSLKGQRVVGLVCRLDEKGVLEQFAAAIIIRDQNISLESTAGTDELVGSLKVGDLFYLSLPVNLWMEKLVLHEDGKSMHEKLLPAGSMVEVYHQYRPGDSGKTRVSMARAKVVDEFVEKLNLRFPPSFIYASNQLLENVDKHTEKLVSDGENQALQTAITGWRDSQNKYPTHNMTIINQNQRTRATIGQNFKVLKNAAIPVFMTLLLYASFAFYINSESSDLMNRKSELQIAEGTHRSLTKQRDSLLNEYKQIKITQLNHHFLSKCLDETFAIRPEGITLANIEWHCPKKQIGERRQVSTVKLEGITSKMESITEWIDLIGELNWAGAISYSSGVVERRHRQLKFKMAIELN